MAKVKKENVEVLYKFTNPNKYLTVSYLGVQFRDGKYETMNRDIAKELINLSGMEMETQEI